MSLLPSISPGGCRGRGVEAEGGRAGGWAQKGQGGVERLERQERFVKGGVHGLGGEGEEVFGRELREVKVAK
ncbi:hypothetical protein NL676_022854 [Syzygium grande]|nr:hypothetical protein NL676_022854 [Syzygium grande]